MQYKVFKEFITLGNEINEHKNKLNKLIDKYNQIKNECDHLQPDGTSAERRTYKHELENYDTTHCYICKKILKEYNPF